MKSYSTAFLKGLAAILLPAFFMTGCSENRQNTQVQNSTPEVISKPSRTELNLNCTAYILKAGQEKDDAFLVVDTVQYFSGDNAQKAFLEDKKLHKSKSTEPPAGFYIRNFRTDTLRFHMSDKPKIIMQTLSIDTTGNFKFNEAIDRNRFLKVFADKKYDYFRNKPFMIEIRHDEITSVKEIYIP